MADIPLGLNTPLIEDSQNGVKYLQQPSTGVPRKRCTENMQQVYRRTTIPKCLTWVSFCKFAAYFQNTFFYEHLLKAASVPGTILYITKKSKSDTLFKKMSVTN